jgi:CBS domain-containing protein
MATVSDILARKGASVVTVGLDNNVLDAAKLMTDRGIGSVLVLDGGKVVGIFTERDVMRRIVAEQRNPVAVKVREVMSTSLATATMTTTIEDCAAMMTERRVRHLPVLEGDKLVGVVSIGDLMAYRVAEQAETIKQLQNYVSGNP